MQAWLQGSDSFGLTEEEVHGSFEGQQRHKMVLRTSGNS
jgi:hypothetical protein